MLAELDSMKNNKELAVMDLCHSVEKAVEMLESGCSFTEHVLNNGSALQLLLLKKLISDQLKSLIAKVPECDIDVNIEFKTDLSSFEEALNKTFGKFTKDEKEEEAKVLVYTYMNKERYQCHSKINLKKSMSCNSQCG